MIEIKKAIHLKILTFFVKRKPILESNERTSLFNFIGAFGKLKHKISMFIGREREFKNERLKVNGKVITIGVWFPRK